MTSSFATYSSYLQAVKSALTSSLCLCRHPSELMERHSRPEIELSSSEHSILSPLEINRSESERVLIERSINSVRISLRIKKADELEKLLIRNFSNFLMQRADSIPVLRRMPAKVNCHSLI